MCPPNMLQALANSAGGDRANDLGVQWMARRAAGDGSQVNAMLPQGPVYGQPPMPTTADFMPQGAAPARPAARPARPGARPAAPTAAGQPGAYPPQPANYAPPLPTTADWAPRGHFAGEANPMAGLPPGMPPEPVQAGAPAYPAQPADYAPPLPTTQDFLRGGGVVGRHATSGALRRAANAQADQAQGAPRRDPLRGMIPPQ